MGTLPQEGIGYPVFQFERYGAYNYLYDVFVGGKHGTKIGRVGRVLRQHWSVGHPFIANFWRNDRSKGLFLTRQGATEDLWDRVKDTIPLPA